MKVILITGKMGAGKTTIASLIENQLVSNGFVVTRTSFASELKKMLRKYFYVSKSIEIDIPEDKDYDIFTMLRIHMFDEDYGFIEESGKTGEFRKLLQSYYQTKDKTFIRKIMQFFGTEIVRAVDPDFWVKCELEKIRKFENVGIDFVIIDDFRFPNEDLSKYIDNVIKIKVEASDEIREQRLGYKPPEHESEVYIDGLEADIVINTDNNCTYVNNIVNTILKSKEEKHGIYSS